jgi:recombination protein RecT
LETGTSKSKTFSEIWSEEMSANLQVIEGDIYALKPQFQSVLTDKSINFEREAGFALQIIGASDYAIKIAMGNRQSVVNAVTNVAAIGISLNPAKKQAYLVPRDGKICLDISYMGLIDLAVQDGAIKWAKAELVYSGDAFTLNGSGQSPTHTYNPFSKERGDVVGAYCVAKLPDGDYLTETMSIEDINAIRDRSSAWKAWISSQKKCPWVTDPGEMARKTVVKRASKYWASNGTDRLKQAVHHLNTEGDEGLATLNEKPATAFDVIAACEAVANCTTVEELQTVWKEQGAKAVAAKDKGGHAALKNEVIQKKATLEKELVTDVEAK